ncbi:hypothetical protein H5410_028767 [Solanum commersonii]|uniref:Uncharacterized protein n=1 Tax=Solanum commersonii TaxID=4109 RepID=A0A9J5Z2U9_SOLCO|nr:hypothetical protein H5410_028767 [Solanum commersonii]
MLCSRSASGGEGLQKMGPKPTMHEMEVIDNPKHSLWYFRPKLLGLGCGRTLRVRIFFMI